MSEAKDEEVAYDLGYTDGHQDGAREAWLIATPIIHKLREALTPSAETKAAYIGEFHFTEEGYDEDGQVYYRKVMVPWTTVKEIMAAISARAALTAQKEEADG